MRKTTILQPSRYFRSVYQISNDKYGVSNRCDYLSVWFLLSNTSSAPSAKCWITTCTTTNTADKQSMRIFSCKACLLASSVSKRSSSTFSLTKLRPVARASVNNKAARLLTTRSFCVSPCPGPRMHCGRALLRRARSLTAINQLVLAKLNHLHLL